MLPQGVVFATAGYDHCVRFWDCTTGACTRTVKFPDSQVNALAVSADKRLVAVAGNPSIKVFDISSSSSSSSRGNTDSTPLAVLEGHTGNVTCVGFDADGRWLYSGGEDGTVRIWDPRASTKECQRTFVGAAASVAAASVPSPSSAAARPISSSSAAAPPPAAAAPPMAPEKNNWSEARKNCVNTVALHPNQVELVSGDAAGRVNVFSLVGKTSSSAASLSIQSPDEGAVRSVCIAGDGSQVFFATDSGQVHSWDPEDADSLLSNSNDAMLVELKPAVRCHDAYILKMSLSPDGKLLATASADHTAKIFRTSDMQQQRVLAKHQRWVWDVSFSADSAYLVTASSDTTARLWDVNKGETVRTFSGHQKAITSVCLNDISRAPTTGEDGDEEED